jgi:hypothetical protein
VRSTITSRSNWLKKITFAIERNVKAWESRPAAQKRRLLLLDQKLDHERVDIVSKNHALAKKLSAT